MFTFGLSVGSFTAPSLSSFLFSCVPALIAASLAAFDLNTEVVPVSLLVAVNTSASVIGLRAVSYTHLTLPTILLV